MAERFFNTTGPVFPARHYSIPPLERFDLDEVLRLIRDERYFVLHAPRQTGKTSALLALRDLLNEDGAHRCVYVNVEAGQTARGDVAAGMRTVLSEISEEAPIALGDGFLDETWERTLARAGPHGALRQALRRWCMNDPKPLVLLIDEIDALVGDTLISVLRQLRAGDPAPPPLDRVQDPAGGPRCGGPRGRGADARLHGPVPRRVGAPGGLRPRRVEAVGGEALPARGVARRTRRDRMGGLKRPCGAAPLCVGRRHARDGREPARGTPARETASNRGRKGIRIPEPVPDYVPSSSARFTRRKWGRSEFSHWPRAAC